MEFKGTPGPWAAYDYVIRDFEGEDQIAQVSEWNGASEAVANARLIAAAPDLLEALQKSLPDLSGQDLLRARAAIAKALGENNV